MSWVAVAVAGAAVVGAVGGNIASNRASDKAAESTKYAADAASQVQWDMYDQTREDFQPFIQPSGRALATLQSAVYGGPVSYNDPNDPTGKTQLQATWQPQETEGFKYTKSRTFEDLGRALRTIGRGSGSSAALAYGRTLGDLNATNETNQRNELWNLVKAGQGAAGSIQNSGLNAANNVSANTINAGNNLATIAQQKGQTQANLWSGLGSTAANAYGTYQMGQYLNKGSSNGALYDSVGGDINKVNFGNF